MADPVWTPYDAPRAQRLIAQVQSTSTFREIAVWDEAAAKEIQYIHQHLDGYESALAVTQQKLASIEQEIKKKSLLARLLRSRKAEIEQRRWTRALPRYRDDAAALEEALQYWVDFTPNDATAKKEMIKELKARKKELGIKKREVAAEIRSVNQNARERNAEISASWLSTPSGRRYSRMQVRMDKAKALRPHETEKGAIERQILEIDRLILWMERLT